MDPVAHALGVDARLLAAQREARELPGRAQRRAQPGVALPWPEDRGEARGDRVEADGEIMILESMKMEIPVLSPKAGTVREIKVNEGEAIDEGQLVAILDA